MQEGKVDSPGEFESVPARQAAPSTKWAAVTGALVGAVVFFLLVFIPGVFVALPYKGWLMMAAAVLGAVQGVYIGPLIMLRVLHYSNRRS